MILLFLMVNLFFIPFLFTLIILLNFLIIRIIQFIIIIIIILAFQLINLTKCFLRVLFYRLMVCQFISLFILQFTPY